MVFISKEKIHVSAYSGHLQVQNLKMAAIGQTCSFFHANKHHNLAIFYSCVFLTEFTSPYIVKCVNLELYKNKDLHAN